MKDDQDVYVDWMSKYGGFSKDMTLRDYFAAKAMQAILSGAEIFWEEAAPLAYEYADAMLKARGQ